MAHRAMKSESWYARDTMCLVDRPSASADAATARVMSSEQVAGGSWLMTPCASRTCAGAAQGQGQGQACKTNTACECSSRGWPARQSLSDGFSWLAAQPIKGNLTLCRDVSMRGLRG